MRRLATLLLVATSLACSQAPQEAADPVASLSSATLSATFDAAYWSAEAKRNTQTWQRALELCREDGHRQLPNCQSVGHVQFLELLHASAKRHARPTTAQAAFPCPRP